MTPKWHWPPPPPWSTPAAAAPSSCPTPRPSTASPRAWGWTGERTHDQAELDAVRELRPRLARLWEAGDDDAAGLVNTLLREAHALPQLVKHDGWDYHLHATPPDAPLADRMAVEAAMAFADVIRTQQLEPAAAVRRGRLRQRPRQPVQEPVPAVLRHLVREPDQRRRLPDAPRRPGRDRDQLRRGARLSAGRGGLEGLADDLYRLAQRSDTSPPMARAVSSKYSRRPV